MDQQTVDLQREVHHLHASGVWTTRPDLSGARRWHLNRGSTKELSSRMDRRGRGLRKTHAVTFTLVDRSDFGKRELALGNFSSAAAGGFAGTGSARVPNS
jgi:hypothetical protein